MAAEDACEHDMLVQIRWQAGKMAIPLSQLEAINPDESTKEAIVDWHYWAIVSMLFLPPTCSLWDKKSVRRVSNPSFLTGDAMASRGSHFPPPGA